MNLFALMLMMSPAPVVVEGDVYVEREFHNASELVSWCRDEAEARVVASGGEPYQWRASHKSQGDTLIVEGKLRVDGEDLTVRCRVARGARERYASIEMVAGG